MQLCPANEKAFAASFSAARSRSASPSTITGVAFPSSRATRFFGARAARAPADRTRPGEGDRLHALVLHEHVADCRRRPDDHVQPARRQPCLGLELGEQQRRQRRLRRRLQHHRAAGREGGRELVGDEVEREVERADRTDDAEGQAERERELPLAGLRRVHRHHVTGELARLDGRRRVGRDCPLRLDACCLHGLSGLGGDRPRNLVVALAQHRRDAVEDRCALVCRQRLDHRALSRVDGTARLVRAGFGDAAD